MTAFREAVTRDGEARQREDLSTTSIRYEREGCFRTCAPGSRRIDYSIPRVATVAKKEGKENKKKKKKRKGEKNRGKDGWKRKRRDAAAVQDNKCEIGSRWSSRWLRLARASNDRDYLNIVR